MSVSVRHTIGLMSGTSLDGIDGVVLALDERDRAQVVASAHMEMPPALREVLLALNDPGHDELHTAARAANALALAQARVVQQLLRTNGLGADRIAAIGSHGQTVRHHPPQPGCLPPVDATLSPMEPPADLLNRWPAYTWQLNNPALLAELTGITVVADFRSRDVAAGGQGAPLVPAFHAAVFARPEPCAVVNIGGMANATVLTPAQAPQGFDTGPGNVLLDAWCQRHTGQPYDREGQWAGQGRVCEPLLQRLLSDPYFSRQGPRSTGRDRFNLAWLQRQLDGGALLAPADVQATLLELTAQTIVRALPPGLSEVVVCGGGAHNAQLMRRIAALMPAVPVRSSADRGIPPTEVEAAAFAWLADRALRSQPANVPEVTGAAGPRILGAIYPA